MLDGVRKEYPTQRHSKGSKWSNWDDCQHDQGPPSHSRAAQQADRRRAELLLDLHRYANPCPTSSDWYFGISHNNLLPENSGTLWDVVRAIASRKQFSFKELQDLCEWPVSKRGGGAGRALVFTEAYPDTRATGGVRSLTEAGWNGLYEDLGIQSEEECVRHLLNLHDGEVRFVGPPWWAEMGPRDRVYHCRYWHAQTMSHKATREWADWNHGGS